MEVGKLVNDRTIEVGRVDQVKLEQGLAQQDGFAGFLLLLLISQGTFQFIRGDQVLFDQIIAQAGQQGFRRGRI